MCRECADDCLKARNGLMQGA
ncbi:hypothetical protein [Erythrobacter neustonensis]